MTNKINTHGGDIYRQKIDLDFSVNINPLGVSVQVMDALKNALNDCIHYPDYSCEDLIEALSGKTGLNTTQIVCGNGASDVFMGIVHAMQPKRAMVFAPSFYGYTYALQAISCEIQYQLLKEEHQFQIQDDFADHMPTDIDMLFLCVPNNPTGVLPEREQVVCILEYCKQHGIIVVYDQCFLEFTDKYKELCGEQFLNEYPNIIVVNAFTKTHAIPGIRLGYACASEEMIAKIAKHLAEWRVSILAMAAGQAALWVEQNTDYFERTRTLLDEERCYLTKQLEQLGICYYPSEADYILLKSELPLYDILLKKRILIRHCDNYVGLGENFYRIAIKKHNDNQELIRVLTDLNYYYKNY